MKTILVTGANKGIGLAIVEAILREHPGYSVLLGSRDRLRGEAAKESLLAIDRDWSKRIEALQLDVSSEHSVSQAKALIISRSGGDARALYGLVNNAGLGSGTVQEVLDVNVYGVRRMCETFAPLVIDRGRIVNITSASGPNFVAKCDAARRDFFLDPHMSWDRLSQFMRDCAELVPADFASLGMASDSPYGLSKACANSYTQYLARCFPDLFVNACTPGFIETDLGVEFLGGRTPTEAGMKTPAEGARVITSLLFNEPEGSGYYYGSDAQRSPMDCYRAPGSPAYTGS